MEGSSSRRIGLWLAVFVAGMLAGSVMLTPVGAHISTFNHLKTKHFYTKSAADARFLDTSEADARFVDTNEAPGLSVAHAATAGRATNVFSAQVNSNGALLGSVPPGATSSRGPIGPGVYHVILQRPVTGCIISSSLGSNDQAIPFGETNVAPLLSNPNAVFVVTANSAGTLEDRDFAVQMICP